MQPTCRQRVGDVNEWATNEYSNRHFNLCIKHVKNYITNNPQMSTFYKYDLIIVSTALAINSSATNSNSNSSAKSIDRALVLHKWWTIVYLRCFKIVSGIFFECNTFASSLCRPGSRNEGSYQLSMPCSW